MMAGFVIILWSSQIYAQSEIYYNVDATSSASIDIGPIIHDDVVDAPNWFVQRLLKLFGLDDYASGTNPATWTTQWATNYVKAVINIAIALAWFVALLVIIYGFAQMLFAWEEEWFAKAKQYVIWAAIALWLLALSWFIVSFIFSIYEAVAL